MSLMKHVFCGMILAGLLSGNMASAQDSMGRPIELIPLTPETAPEPSGPTPTFKANVGITKMLPQEMYGTWSVTSKYVDGDAPPSIVLALVSLIWTLETNGREIILKNPSTEAVTQVHVDDVKGKTATFHHSMMSPNGNKQIIEHITLTVADNQVYGTERAEYLFLRDGVPIKSFILNLALEGKRLAGATVTFGHVDRPENFFEIEPLRHE